MIFAVFATAPNLGGCAGTPNQPGTPLTPSEEVQQRFYTPECRQMQEKLATDQNLTPWTVATITGFYASDHGHDYVSPDFAA